MGGVGKLLSGPTGAVASVTRGMNISPLIQSALGAIAEKGDQRAAFNGILLASAANALKKPNFNLELEINDLNVRLGNLRGMEATANAQQMIAKQAAMFDGLSQILSKYDDAAKAIIQNMK